MEEVEFPPISFFVGHGYVHQAEIERRGDHCIWYHCYLVSENFDLSDAIAFGYGDSAALGSKMTIVFLMRVWTSKRVTWMEMW